MTAPARPELTEREREVLRLASEGLTYEEIAKRIYVIPRRATEIKTNALRKLGAKNIANGILLACRAGLLDGRPQHHGDHNGYEAHIRRGDRGRDICDACRSGEKAYRARLREARQAQEGPCVPVSRSFRAPADSGPSGPVNASEAHSPASRPTNQTKAA